jgi:hypothetical protein
MRAEDTHAPSLGGIRIRRDAESYCGEIDIDGSLEVTQDGASMSAAVFDKLLNAYAALHSKEVPSQEPDETLRWDVIESRPAAIIQRGRIVTVLDGFVDAERARRAANKLNSMHSKEAPAEPCPSRAGDVKCERPKGHPGRHAYVDAWPCPVCGQSGPFACCGGCYCKCRCLNPEAPSQSANLAHPSEVPALLDRERVALLVEEIIDHAIESDVSTRCFNPPSPYALGMADRIISALTGEVAAPRDTMETEGTLDGDWRVQMIVCPKCGAKRCPRATDQHARCKADVMAELEAAEAHHDECYNDRFNAGAWICHRRCPIGGEDGENQRAPSEADKEQAAAPPPEGEEP